MGFFLYHIVLIYSAIHGNNNKYIAAWLRYRWVLFYENITADIFGTAGQSQNDRGIIGFTTGA